MTKSKADTRARLAAIVDKATMRGRPKKSEPTEPTMKKSSLSAAVEKANKRRR